MQRGFAQFQRVCYTRRHSSARITQHLLSPEVEVYPCEKGTYILTCKPSGATSHEQFR
jgi:hypothetical protein